nr:hypothetical protein GCM10020093_072850 [Planobispora longispora]
MTAVTFEDSGEAYEAFKRMYGEDDVLVRAIQAEDMPESFRALVDDGADRQMIIDTMRGSAASPSCPPSSARRPWSRAEPVRPTLNGLGRRSPRR